MVMQILYIFTSIDVVLKLLPVVFTALLVKEAIFSKESSGT